LYSYGGFENTQPDIPIGRLFQVNIVEMLSSVPVLQKQIKDLTKGNGPNGQTGSDTEKKDFLQESILNKYDLNPNVVVARIEQQNFNKALHYYPLNALQKEAEKINSTFFYKERVFVKRVSQSNSKSILDTRIRGPTTSSTLCAKQF
jgi:hypothetical protein